MDWRTISQDPSAFPPRTFQGRERVSHLPRWIGNWITVIVTVYFMGSYILRFMGFQDLGFDPFASNSGVSGSAVSPGVDSPGYNSQVPDQPIIPQEFYASSDGLKLMATQTALSNYIYPGQTSLPSQPTYTPLPTLTPYPTVRTFYALNEVYAIGYSYYYPPYGPPNCHPENWKDNAYCLDILPSGDRWSDMIGLGVAVPIQWRDRLPLGSYIQVHEPYEMRGKYKVVDYCGGCIKPEGHIYFDFLDNRARLNWTVPMLVQVVYVPSLPGSTPTPTQIPGTN